MTAWHTLKTYVRQRLGGDRVSRQLHGFITTDFLTPVFYIQSTARDIPKTES